MASIEHGSRRRSVASASGLSKPYGAAHHQEKAQRVPKANDHSRALNWDAIEMPLLMAMRDMSPTAQMSIVRRAPEILAQAAC